MFVYKVSPSDSWWHLIKLFEVINAKLSKTVTW